MRRIHWLSWVALMVAILLSAIFVVPGIQVREYHLDPVTGLPRSTYDVVFSHGWPLEYMRSPIERGQLFTDKLEWLWLKAWPIHGNTCNFRLSNLLIDLLICLVITFAAICAVSIWREKNARYSFTIRKLLTGTALTAFFISWYCWYHSHANDRAIEIASDYEFRTSGSKSVYPDCEFDYRGPGWLRRLVGRNWLGFCHHRTSVVLTPTIVGQLAESNSPAIHKLRRAESIACKCSSKQLIHILRNFQKLRHLLELKITLNDKPGFGYLDLSQSESLIANNNETKNNLADSNQDQQLGLVITEELALLSNLTSLSIIRSRESAEGLRNGLSNLSRLSRLNDLELAAQDFFIEDIQFLNQLDSLETVKIEITATDNELKAFQSRHPHLRIDWPANWQLNDQRVLEARFQRELGENLSIIAEPQSLTIEKQLKSTHLKFLQNRVLGSYVKQLASLELGIVDTDETAMALISCCKNLESLQVPEVSFSADELARLPQGIITLGIQQGDLTVVDFQKLISKLPDGNLEIYQSIFTREQALTIQKSAPDCGLTVYGLTTPGKSSEPVIYQW